MCFPLVSISFLFWFCNDLPLVALCTSVALGDLKHFLLPPTLLILLHSWWVTPFFLLNSIFNSPNKSLLFYLLFYTLEWCYQILYILLASNGLIGVHTFFVILGYNRPKQLLTNAYTIVDNVLSFLCFSRFNLNLHQISPTFCCLLMATISFAGA